MKMKMSVAVALIAVLTVMCVSTALAEAPIDPYHEASDYFKQTYVLEGDLGDESIPVVLLGGLTVLTAVGAVVVHRKRIWYFSNGEKAKESCIYSLKETAASEDPNDFSFDDLTKEFVAYLDVGFASREESLRFMKKVPEPIKGIYAMVPDAVREYVSELGLDKKLQTFGWVMVMRIYFDEDQQIGRCEMGFGDYGDGIVLDWGIEKDGSIRRIRKWQGVLNFFV